MQRYTSQDTRSDVLIQGRSIGQKIGTGRPHYSFALQSEMNRVRPGDVLVSDMTDPTGSRS